MVLFHAAPRLIVARLAAAGERVHLSRPEAAHARAHRLARGDAVILVDGSGAEAHGALVRLDRGGAEVRIERVVAARPEGMDIRLALAGLRAERLAWVAEKGTELGARRILLVRSERTQSFRASADLLARLARVAQEAAKQSEAARWPVFEGPCALSELLARPGGGARILLDGSGAPFPSELSPGQPLSLCVGPEGGWTDAEREEARHAGWAVCSLPAGKLRAETAAVAALVLARAALARAAYGAV